MENELSIKISASAEKALKSLDKLIPKINQTDNAVSKMLMNFDTNGQLTGFTAELKKLDSEMTKVTKNSKNLKSALNLSVVFAGASKMFRTGLDWMTKSTSYSEALNLFNVVLDESIDKGIKFQNVMNEAFGTNQTDTLTRQGLYQSMAENMGIAQEYAYVMSETTTKLVNDISSLYNKNENTVAEALRAGVFAGQTKPLRSFGVDITEKSLQPVLDELGIKNFDGTAKTVRELSQAEKQILRYIAVLKQSSEAHGDWANTIESPSNQLKIFNNQLTEAQKAFANLFIGTFGKILPYANAILMVIEEVSNALATMLGIEISDYNTGIADMSDAFADVEDTVTGTSDAVKELKRQTLGFDQINNLTDNNNGSGSGSSINGGIDQKLLDAISSYDNGMDSVRMKATQIRDRIMEWLGFTKEINPLTGDVAFKLKNGWTNFKKIVTAVKALIVFVTAKKIFSGLAKLVTLLTSAGKIASSVKKGFVGLGALFAGLTLPISATTAAIVAFVSGLTLITAGLAVEFAKPAIKQFNELRKASSETREKLEPLIDKFDDLNLAIKTIDYSNAVMTDEQASQILSKIDDTFNSVKEKIIEQKAQAIQEINELSESMGLSDKERQKLLDENDNYYTNALSQLEKYKKRYIEIVDKAKSENRTLTTQEMSEIYKIQSQAQKLTIESLSSSSAEAKAIYEDVCNNAKAKSAEQASEIIKNSIKVRDETIENAKQQKEETLAQIASLKTDGSAESEALKNKMIENANKTYEDTVTSAKKMHQDTYNEFKRQNEDIAKYIDKDSGNIKSNWSVFWSDLNKTFSDFFNSIETGWENLWNKLSGKKAVRVELSDEAKSGFSQKAITISKLPSKANGGIFANGKWRSITQYANGGLPPVGQMFIAREKGPELVGSIGSKTAVMNNTQIVESVKLGVYEAVASAMSQVSFGGQDIRVYADEGIIVEKAVRGIQNYVTQTGELPFTVPV